MHSPLLTVALSVFNGGAQLRPAILSIVQQTFVDWELLLIDDGSTDGAVDVIAEINDPRIRIVRDGQNLGLAARLNQAIDLARGALFARMDGDDISHPQRFAQQVELLQGDASVDLVATQCLTICENDEIVGALPGLGSHREICRRPWLGFYFPHPTWMGRIEWFRQHHYAFSAPFCCEDQELLLRTHVVSQFRLIERRLLAYRLRDRIHWKKAMRTRLAWQRVQCQYFLGRGELISAMLATVVFILRVGKDSLTVAMGESCGRNTRVFAREHVSDSDYEFWKEMLNRLRGGRDA